MITRTFWDPRNPDPPLRRQGPHGTSIHTGSQAPPQPEWRTGRGPLERHVGERLEGRIVEDSLEVPRGSGPRRHLLYLPAPDAQEQSVSTSGLPLLVLFDAEVWFDELGLPHALEAAVRAGRLPPLAVLGLTTSGRADRFRSLGANSAFLAGVAETSIPWAERAAVAQGILLAGRDRRILAGQSLGGLSALVGALELPDAFGAALAHSASLWWEHQEAGPEGFMPAPPRFDREPGNNWITARFREASARDVRIRLEVGTREGPAAAHNRALHRVLLECGWESEQHLYEGGHDWACWRGCLIDGLDWALSPPTPTE
ncbi:esterase family protein [Kocuria coralli]|uniref:Esterase family protein n=1 Tax=Kocuria coralli TaxID=1461025 RepID=A0A5J5L185_9MICC|nr:esterase family protein [Kocuria coralli]